MASGKNRINFFISMDTVMAYLEKHVVDQEVSADTVYFDCAFTADIMEGPFRLFYRGSPEEVEFEIDTRFSLYQVEEEESRRKARAVLNREGEVSGEAPEEIRGLLQGYLAFCTSFSSYLREHGIFDRYGDLDPEQEGILVEFSGNDLELRHVSGNDRPDLVCQTLSGETKLMRPYSSDFMKSTLLGMMDAETKEKAAEAGDVAMMHHLFEYYMGNVETPQNDLNHMMKLMKTLGTVLGKETEIPEEEEEQDSRNPEKAFYWLKKIAETGDAGAMNALSIFYTKGFGTERDFRKAAEWRKKAADHGLEAAEGQDEMLLMIAETKEQAEAGNTEAQAKYAGILALLAQDNTELGSDADNAEAFQWAQKSAAKFDLNGIFTLARFYADGTGTVKDDVKALRLLERAAGKGHAPSQARLGQMYFQGEGTEENPKAAFEWSRKAAEAGDMNGMDNLAACYLLGKGVDQNPGKAVEWLQKAAELGDESAKGLLEKLGAPLKPQLDEERQPQTVEEAEQMAEQGSVSAMKLLANYYINRPGGREDLYEAQKWAKMAADLGDEDAKAIWQNIQDNLEGKKAPFSEVKADAEKGNPVAQKLLGDYYATGYETERDLVKALYWMKKAAASGNVRVTEQAQVFVDNFSDIEEIVTAAEKGDPQAQARLSEKCLILGQIYEDLNEEMQAEMFRLAQSSAEKDNPYGLFALGQCFENGAGTEQDNEKAFSLYRRAAEMGNPRAQLSLSTCYLIGKGTEINPVAAIHWLEKAREQECLENEGMMETFIGLLFWVGLDIFASGERSGLHDEEKGYMLIEKAAQLNNGQAQAVMGSFYLNGNHVEQDFEKAMEWFRKGAENGDENAVNSLAQNDKPEAYYAAANMEFAKKDQADKEKVFRLMKHAAEGGLAVSQSTLGVCYMKGYGVLPDYEAGMEWFRKAADQGDENGKKALMQYDTAEGWSRAARMELRTKDRKPDQEKAYRMMKRAAEAGLASAQDNLGLFYMSGIGIKADYQTGMEWFRKAADQGYDSAIKNIQKYQSADGLFLAAAGHNAYAQKTKTVCPDGYELLTSAIAAGSAEAINMQGVLYGGAVKIAEAFGQTVEKNYEKARACFEKALEIKPDLEIAKNNLKKLEDVEEAERVGREPDAALKWIYWQKRPSQNTAGQA